MNKREFLRNLGMSGVALAGTKALGAVIPPTPSQTEGPFYADKNNDLTYVKGHQQRAQGEVILIAGQVVDSETGKPVVDALVDIWQACHTGKYAHIADPNNSAYDPNFQYSGVCITNEAGQYAFKTILPGAYQATSDWKRPPHIHYKVMKRGFRELTTQLYFDLPDLKDLNNKDRILQELSKQDQKRVLIPAGTNQSGTKVFHFNISISKL